MLVTCPNCLFRFEAAVESKELLCPKCQNSFSNPKTASSEDLKSHLESEMDDFFKEIELAWEQEPRKKTGAISDKITPPSEITDKTKKYPVEEKKTSPVPAEEDDKTTDTSLLFDDQKFPGSPATTDDPGTSPLKKTVGYDFKALKTNYQEITTEIENKLKKQEQSIPEKDHSVSAFETVEIDSKMFVSDTDTRKIVDSFETVDVGKLEPKKTDESSKFSNLDFGKAFQIDEILSKTEETGKVKKQAPEREMPAAPKERIDSFFVDPSETSQSLDSVKRPEIAPDLGTFESAPEISVDIGKTGAKEEFKKEIIKERRMPAAKAGIPRSAKLSIVFLLVIIIAGIIAGQTNLGYFFTGMFRSEKEKKQVTVVETKAKTGQIIRDSLEEFVNEIDKLEDLLKTDDNNKTRDRLLELVLKLQERFPDEFNSIKRFQALLKIAEGRHTFQKGELSAVLMSINTGKYDEAKTLLDEMLVNNVKDLELRYYYGKVSMLLNQNDVAERYFHTILNDNPNYLPAKFFLAKILLKQGDLPKSKTLFEEIISVDPENNSAKIELAEILLKEKDFDRVEALVNESLIKAKKNKDPVEEFRTRKILASIYATRKNTESWVEQLGYIVQLKPDYEDSVANLSRHYLGIGKLHEALQLLKTCKERGCKGKEFFELLLETNYRLDEEDDGNTVLEEAVKMFPENPKFFYLRGKFLSDGGKYDEAVKYFSKALKLDSSYTDAYTASSLAMLKLGKSTEAIAMLEESLSKVPSPVPIYEEIGRVYTERGDLKKADEIYRKLISQDPVNLNYKLKLASTLYSLGRYEESAKLFETSMSKGMMTEEITIRYVQNLIKLHNYKKAEEELQRVLSENPDNAEVNALLGYIYTEMKDIDRGASLLANALKIDPANPMVYFYMGLNDIAKGEIGKGLDSLMRSVQLDPENLEYKYRLAKALSETGRKEDVTSAKNHLNAVIKEIEKSDTHAVKLSNNADVYLLRGKIMFADAKFSTALKDIEKAVLVDPSRLDIMVTYAKTLYELGSFNEAEAYFHETLQKDSGLSESNYYMGLIFIRKSNKNEALNYFLKAVEKDEKAFPDALKLLGFLYKEKGLKTHAKKYFELFLKNAPPNDPSLKEIQHTIEML
jgi:tetratricopeptide (TPR) repeat protein